MTFRLGAAVAAIAFGVTSSVPSMDAHQLTGRGGHFLAAEATGAGASLHTQAEHAQLQPEAGHAASHVLEPRSEDGGLSPRSTHSGHPQHGSTDECSCVGPCVSGAPPTLSEQPLGTVWLGEAHHGRVVPAHARVIHQDPRSHLLPLPNAPPVRV